MLNLTASLTATKDRYARKLGDFILSDVFERIGNADDVLDLLSAIGGRMFRVVYRCKDGKVRDMIGRQGVYNSKADGEVQGIGRAMRSATTLSFWTDAQGGKVNTGTGSGYRTLRADGILALRIDGVDILTDEGVRTLAG